VPWVTALLGRLMGEAAQPLLAGHLRFVIGRWVDGARSGGDGHPVSAASGPRSGPAGVAYSLVTDEHTGERLTHYPLQDGDVVLADRGYNQVDQWMDLADRGRRHRRAA